MQRNGIVTGGVNGIGRRITELFLSQGHAVAVIDKDDQGAKSLSLQYNHCHVYHGDIAEKSALDQFALFCMNIFPGIDFIVHNACLSRRGILSGCSYEDFEYVQRVGVTAPYYLTMLLLQKLTPGASVVNIASSRWMQSQPDTESYTAAKGGIVSLTHALSVSLAGRARVNAVSPGWIDTSPQGRHSPADMAQHPAGRVGASDDIGHLVEYLCSNKAGFITGQNFVVDGGMTHQMIYHGDCGWSYTPQPNQP